MFQRQHLLEKRIPLEINFQIFSSLFFGKGKNVFQNFFSKSSDFISFLCVNRLPSFLVDQHQFHLAWISLLALPTIISLIGRRYKFELHPFIIQARTLRMEQTYQERQFDHYTFYRNFASFGILDFAWMFENL